MALFDLPLDQLRDRRSSSVEPADFDQFWTDTLGQARQYDLAARFERTATGLTTLDTYDVTFAGFGGHPVRGWFTVPAGSTEPLPVVVEFVGYGGGRGLAHSHLLWASAGYAHFVMDTRGQGSGWSVGDTEDPVGSTPAVPGFLTRGIEDPYDFYYRRVFTDAVRAVEAARSHPLVDASRTVAAGISQGGGITVAVGGLVPDLAAIAPDVPFLCDFPRAVTITDTLPYREVGRYLSVHRDRKARVLDTLAYFDGVHFAARGRAPALFSTALEDETCPPSTVFAAFNAYAGQDKQIEVYDFNGHEGGGPHQQSAQLRWLPGKLAGNEKA
ncbi:acetylxylan esterase [Streptomyces cocklensis]|jgi:cephalosporin-C deacetylase|uniref:Cephalosporin-C deacetylase n=1 Tax=Actinacidiphila cocklensis TaxID=887465 RepID=A0A9W4DUU6_9ACTN|nr:acetylxylan esterase [Actinacidiphila cocklensis]MDD1059134.1 acetylxylan esterase [Actinacidiphila cocklensis]WSX73355.1 acetylxylan esterase [Streptomyces sp. NBC_00899]WSX80579.1 acetylxylan esterase [Streptomyces sp. NBC_00899]CAG6394362.1 Cephalosporin-C deacetylase [Actinacidiphila cocklensis]